jgi:hypothetical protein
MVRVGRRQAGEQAGDRIETGAGARIGACRRLRNGCGRDQEGKQENRAPEEMQRARPVG